LELYSYDNKALHKRKGFIVIFKSILKPKLAL